MLDAQDKDGNTAVHYLIGNNCSDDVIDALIAAEADFPIQNNYNKTPFMIMLEKVNKDNIIKVLEANIRNKDVMINTQDIYGDTAAHHYNRSIIIVMIYLMH